MLFHCWTRSNLSPVLHGLVIPHLAMFDYQNSELMMRISFVFAAMLFAAFQLKMADGSFPDPIADVKEDIQVLRMLEPGDESMVKGAEVAARLRDAADCNLLDLLSAMRGAKPVGKNWLLGIANKRYLKERGRPIRFRTISCRSFE